MRTHRTLLSLLATFIVALGLIGGAQAAGGLTWTGRLAASDAAWISVAYGNGTYVAVADGLSTGGGNRVMTSTDAVTWTAHASSDDTVAWRSVTFGADRFVAVGILNNNAGRVMSSPDGVNWTPQVTGDSVNRWDEVIYANGRFVAVGRSPQSGSAASRVMTSVDGLNWTLGGGGETLLGNWYDVAYGNGVFVAVGNLRAMTSSNGVDWSASTTPGATANNEWRGVTFGNGTFVAVSQSGSTARVMTSTDGATWTAQTGAPTTNSWYDIAFGDGRFVAVAETGTNRVMTSTDGVTWTAQAAAPDSSGWQGIGYGGGQFVAVATSGFPNQVMTAAGPAVSSVPWTLVRQALPMPMTGTCADVVDAAYAWGTGLRGGWQRAWEPWVVNADGSRGGWACLRVLVNPGTDQWRIDNSVA